VIHQVRRAGFAVDRRIGTQAAKLAPWLKGGQMLKRLFVLLQSLKAHPLKDFVAKNPGALSARARFNTQ
jgi:hypothetical protein